MTDKPPLDELAHHGVLGMKWGHRKAANAGQIRAARRNVSKMRDGVAAQRHKATAAKGTSSAKVENKKLSDLKASYLNNPDRVIAARMTRGEKFIAIVGGSIALPGAGFVPGLAVVTATSARSRKIEQQQADGAYNKKK